MRLNFAEDKVADEVPSIVGMYHRPLFRADACLICTLRIFLYSFRLSRLERLAFAWLTVDIPISCWLGELIASKVAIPIDHRRLCDKAAAYKRVHTKWVFHYQA